MPKRPTRFGVRETAEILDQIAQGLSSNRVALLHHTSHRQILNICSRHGVKPSRARGDNSGIGTLYGLKDTELPPLTMDGIDPVKEFPASDTFQLCLEDRARLEYVRALKIKKWHLLNDPNEPGAKNDTTSKYP